MTDKMLSIIRKDVQFSMELDEKLKSAFVKIVLLELVTRRHDPRTY